MPHWLSFTGEGFKSPTSKLRHGRGVHGASELQETMTPACCLQCFVCAQHGHSPDGVQVPCR